MEQLCTCPSQASCLLLPHWQSQSHGRGVCTGMGGVRGLSWDLQRGFSSMSEEPLGQLWG